MIYDDIAAIATPPGEGGIAIVRLSGDNVIEYIDKIFLPFKQKNKISMRKTHTLTLGWILDKDFQKIDEVLIAVMRGPHSYTGEDVIEINCHGGTIAARSCLQRCLDMGIRLAEAGEFSKRAYLNGRLDISQAEAIVDIIRAKTERGLRLAIEQLQGKNKYFFEEIEEKLIKLNAMIEASLDFPEDVGEINSNEAGFILKEIKINLNKILEASKNAEVFREGIRVAICGKPNVGKSSLLNVLVRKEKAIVTPVPGTTRDIIEEYINVRGIPVKLMDTAGIRITEDIVEKIGVEKTKEAIEKADIIIFLLDVESGITTEDLDIYNRLDKEKTIVLINKEDLERNNISEREIEEYFNNVKIIRASVKEEQGIIDLEETIEYMALNGQINSDGLEVMINIRQKNALLKSLEHVENAIATLNEVPLDCLGVDIWGALEALGEINGKSLKDEVIDKIFHDFCIGK